MADEQDIQVNDDEQPSFSFGRRFGFGFGVVVAVVAFFAIVVMVNYVAARHFKRYHFGNPSLRPLSPQTLGVLQGLTNDVRVVILFDRDEPLYASVSALLGEYRHASPRIRLEYVDYVRDAEAARAVKEQYRLQHIADKDLILFDSGGRVRAVYERELSDYDYSGLVAGTTNEVKRIAFKGEALFTSAIFGVTDSRQVRACYVVGHGEHKPQDEADPFGYARFIGLLREKNISIEGITLFGTNDVPAYCDLLVIAGPTDLFGQSETDKLEKYLNQGGRMLLLLNSLAQTTGLERMLANWGVSIGNNLVIDPKNTRNGQDLITGTFGQHPAVRGLYGTRGLYFSMPRTVEKLAIGGAAEAAKVEELVRSGDTAIAVTDIRGGMINPGPRDRRGSLTIAVAVEKGGLREVKSDRGATRMVVVGESRFLGNSAIENLANRDFASLAINWLLDRQMLLGGIGPRPVAEYRLDLTRGQMLKLRLILLAALPGGVLLLGGLVWLRRRR
jgi:hypothetical protein